MPTEIRLLEGNRGHKALNRYEPKPKRVMPEAPEWLDDVAMREWTRVSVLLWDLNLLTEADGPSLAAYCQAYSLWREAAEDIKENGLTMVNERTGAIHANPAVAMLQKALNQIKIFAQEFGMSPSARSRLQVKNEDGSDDELEELLR